MEPKKSGKNQEIDGYGTYKRLEIKQVIYLSYNLLYKSKANRSPQQVACNNQQVLQQVTQLVVQQKQSKVK